MSVFMEHDDETRIGTVVFLPVPQCRVRRRAFDATEIDAGDFVGELVANLLDLTLALQEVDVEFRFRAAARSIGTQHEKANVSKGFDLSDVLLRPALRPIG